MVDSARIERIEVETGHPVAVDSPDHLSPFGTSRDNSTNPLFNEKLYRLFAGLGRMPRVLDLGCSGGGFVRSCVDDGCLAVGIEGSDHSRRFGRAEWPRGDGKFLFTADITKPFSVVGVSDGERVPLTFDLVTSWEVMEHIAEADVPAVFENIRRHLAPNGLVVLSISTNEHDVHDHDAGETHHLHQTVRPASWWLSRLAAEGFEHHPEYVRFFNTQFIRGPKQNAPGSFHLVLCRRRDSPPAPPPVSVKRTIYERWIGSTPQRTLRRLVG